MVTPAPPPTARGTCPGAGAEPYVRAAWHYVRVLALCARAQRARQEGLASAAELRAQAAEDLQGLQVRACCLGDQQCFANYPGEPIK